MDGVKEAFEIVFGEEFINEMFTRLVIIFSRWQQSCFISCLFQFGKQSQHEKLKSDITFGRVS